MGEGYIPISSLCNFLSSCSPSELKFSFKSQRLDFIVASMLYALKMTYGIFDVFQMSSFEMFLVYQERLRCIWILRYIYFLNIALEDKVTSSFYLVAINYYYSCIYIIHDEHLVQTIASQIFITTFMDNIFETNTSLK